MGRLDSIQALRFVAAAMVVLCHANPVFTAGAAGVDVFFVISGFVITRAATEPAAFIRARLTRILPIYYVCSIPWLLVALSQGLMTPQMAVATVTLWPAYDEIVRPVLKVGWTLSFELLFYGAMALVLFQRRLLWVLISAYLLCLWGAFATKAPVLTFIGNPLIAEFGVGVLMARMTAVRPKLGAVAFAAGVLALVLLWRTDFTPGQVFDMTAPERVIVWGIPAALMVWGAAQHAERFWRPLTFLGDASYSIYLTHLMALLFLKALPWPVAMVLVIALGAAVHHYVEKPLLGFFRRPLTAAQTA